MAEDGKKFAFAVGHTMQCVLQLLLTTQRPLHTSLRSAGFSDPADTHRFCVS